jgi:hypothetical protein
MNGTDNIRNNALINQKILTKALAGNVGRHFIVRSMQMRCVEFADEPIP